MGQDYHSNRIEYFLTLFDIDDSGCWIWKNRKNNGGYGSFSLNGAPIGAHRFSYELFVGGIPDKYTIDHLCRNRACVNPEHMEPVTLRENTLRGIGPFAQKAKQTHCKHGHEFTPENTRTDRGKRECKTCNRIYDNGRNGKRDAAHWREYRRLRKEAGRPVRAKKVLSEPAK